MFTITELAIKNLDIYLTKENFDCLILYPNFLKAGGCVGVCPLHTPLIAFFIRGRNILFQISGRGAGGAYSKSCKKFIKVLRLVLK